MIQSLKRKLVFTLTLAWAIVLALVVGGVNLASARMNAVQNQTLLALAAENGGLLPPAGPERGEKQGVIDEARVVSAILDEEGNVLEVIGPQDALPSWAGELAGLERSARMGQRDGYRYLVRREKSGYLAVFLDQRVSDRVSRRFLLISVGVAGVALCGLFLLSLLLIGRMVRPVEEGFARQKRFIADAGHELKTPLSVIGVNVEVLRRQQGESKYLDYIQSETSRMSEMVRNLLDLARLEQPNNQAQTGPVDLGKLTEGVALPFESRAFEEEKTYTLAVEPGVICRCEAESLQRLCAILLDNAFKNAPSGGDIRVGLRREGDTALLWVFNTGAPIAPEERERIFERFYRTDQSRSKQTGGYGLGLAIADAIVQRRRGKIWVDPSPKDGVKFCVRLPL